MMRISATLLLISVVTIATLVSAPAAELRAGASAIDISPRVLPAIRNGGFLEATSNRVDDPLHARSLVLADGRTTLCITIVDSCMVPRELCDEIKQRVSQKCGVAEDRILIAATHTHSAPSLMDYCLGTRQDPAYADYFVPRVVEGIAQAHAALVPAKIAWTVVDAPDHTHSRRWIRRPDTFALDPFGDQTVRAMMHPGYQNPEFLGPSGPVDTGLTVLAVQTYGGKPLAVLANYSMHYFGADAGFSADYFGEFARHVEGRLSEGHKDTPRVVAIMSQGTSGDLHWMDYARRSERTFGAAQYAQELGEMATGSLASMNYRADVELSMAETRLTLSRRLPSAARLQSARELNAKRGPRRPQNQPEVYAEQAVWIHEHPQTELKLQALRIGELGLTAIPNEVFAITGLKLKAQSPLVPLANLELANGAEGYIPPPQQHYMGGYTTWPARTAGLETEAEPKIVEALLGLLEQVAGGAKRRKLTTDFYTPEQRAAMEQAHSDDNNRENRGATKQ